MVSRRTLAVSLAVALGLVALVGILVVTSPFFFALAFGLACLVGLLSIPLAGRGAGLATLLALVQAVLLIGVAQAHFGLMQGFWPVTAVARLGWVTLVIFGIQALLIVYRAAEWWAPS